MKIMLNNIRVNMDSALVRVNRATHRQNDSFWILRLKSTASPIAARHYGSWGHLGAQFGL
jgi:hypothetical protein